MDKKKLLVLFIVAVFILWMPITSWLVDLSIYQELYSKKAGVEYITDFFLYRGGRLSLALILSLAFILPSLLVSPAKSLLLSFLNFLASKRLARLEKKRKYKSLPPDLLEALASKTYKEIEEVKVSKKATFLWRAFQFFITFSFFFATTPFLINYLLSLKSPVALFEGVGLGIKWCLNPYTSSEEILSNLNILVSHSFWWYVALIFSVSLIARLLFYTAETSYRRDFYKKSLSAVLILDILYIDYFLTIPRWENVVWSTLKLYFLLATGLWLTGLTLLTVYGDLKKLGKDFFKGCVKKYFLALLVLIIVFGGVWFTNYKIRESIYEKEWVWGTKTVKAIHITKTLAGIDTIHRENLGQLKTNLSSTYVLNKTRIWDYMASFRRTLPLVGASWMRPSDSDIVFVNKTGSEYWIIPMRLNEDYIGGDWLKKHVLYTHAEGLIILDPTTGEIIPPSEVKKLLGVSSIIPIYYSEGRDIPEVYLTTKYKEITTSNWSFNSEPDVRLTGFVKFAKLFPHFGFIQEESVGLLTLRNSFERVENILLPGLTVGPEESRDAYPVFHNGKMYFAVHVWIDLNLPIPYSQSPYLQLLGVILVDSYDGHMEFYLPPEITVNKYLKPIYGFYRSYYPWQTPPQWLIEQWRYPEPLLEKQLATDFLYHISDFDTWKGRTDVFTFPVDTRKGEEVWWSGVYYIMFPVNNSFRFVGIQMAELKGHYLAGVYVVFHGKNFGRITFYRVGIIGKSNTVGPVKALHLLESNEKVAEAMTLLGSGLRHGNVFFMRLKNKTFYVVPMYKEVQNVERHVATVVLDAEAQKVEISQLPGAQSVIEAFNKLYGVKKQIEKEQWVNVQKIKVLLNWVKGGETIWVIHLLPANQTVFATTKELSDEEIFTLLSQQPCNVKIEKGYIVAVKTLK